MGGVGCWLLAVGRWLLVVGRWRWLLAVGCWLLAVGYWLLAVGCWLLVVGCWPLAVGCWLLAVGRWLLAVGVGCWLLAIGRWLAFWRICNPPALIIGICNAENHRVLYSLSEFYRIKNPNIKRGRISNPPERAPERATKNFVSNSFLAFLRTPWRFFVSSSV